MKCLICHESIEKSNVAFVENNGVSHNSNCQSNFCGPCISLWSEKSRECPACRQVYTMIRTEKFQKYIDPNKTLQIDPEPYTEEEIIFQSLDYEEQLIQNNETVQEVALKARWFLDNEDVDFFLEEVLDSLYFLSLEENLYDLDLLKQKTDYILGSMYHISHQRQLKLAQVMKTWWIRYKQARRRIKCPVCRSFFHNIHKCIYKDCDDPITKRIQQETLQQDLRAYVYFKMKNSASAIN